jgi:hypothetical protein
LENLAEEWLRIQQKHDHDISRKVVIKQAEEREESSGSSLRFGSTVSMSQNFELYAAHSVNSFN